MKTFVFKFLLPIAVLAAVGYFAFSRIAPEAVVINPIRGVAPKVVSGTVRVVSEKRSELRSDIGGRIENSRLELGKTVEEGELLIELDDSDLALKIARIQLDLDAARELAKQESRHERSLAAAQQRLEAAKLDLERGFTSESQLEAIRREVAAQEEAVAQDKKNRELEVSRLENDLEQLELQRSKMTLKSPINGIVYAIHAYKGDLIGQGHPIASIASLDTIVEAQVSEENFADLKVGLPARVKLLGFGDETFGGTIRRIIPVATDTQRYSVLLDLDIDPSRLSDGLTGETSITVDEREDALLIPKKAVNGDSVFVVEGGQAKIKELELGYSSLTMVEVLDGLNEDDQIIVEDLNLFRNGQRVRPVKK